MPQSATPASLRLQLSAALKQHTVRSRAIRFEKNQIVYSSGDRGENLYLVESGQIKLIVFSASGRESVLAIYSTGDIFGELCLFYPGERFETAIAMNKACIKSIPRSAFLSYPSSDVMVQTFVKYLVVRISDQYSVINDFVMFEGEQRLGNTLLRLARATGVESPSGITFNFRITHEELSAMVGTTRPRISKFMRRFRQLGLIGLSAGRLIIVKEKNLADYLDRFS